MSKNDYTIVYVDGKKLNQRTKDMLDRAERRLGYQLYVVQGSYNAGGVSASAGTHDGGGAVDVPVGSNPDEIVRALREVGFAAWHRTSSQGPWNPHIHAIAIADAQLSSGAKNQVNDYYNGRNGLASRAPDDGPRITPIPVWPIKTGRLWYARVSLEFKSKKPTARVSVRRFQRALQGRGYYTGKLDGVLGPWTKKSYYAFLTKRGLAGGFNRKNVRILCDGYYNVV